MEANNESPAQPAPDTPKEVSHEEIGGASSDADVPQTSYSSASVPIQSDADELDDSNPELWESFRPRGPVQHPGSGGKKGQSTGR